MALWLRVYTILHYRHHSRRPDIFYYFFEYFGTLFNSSARVYVQIPLSYTVLYYENLKVEPLIYAVLVLIYYSIDLIFSRLSDVIANFTLQMNFEFQSIGH